MERYAGIPIDKIAAPPMVIEGAFDDEHVAFGPLSNRFEEYIRKEHSRGNKEPYANEYGEYGYEIEVPEEGFRAAITFEPRSRQEIVLYKYFDNRSSAGDEDYAEMHRIAKEIGLDQLVKSARSKPTGGSYLDDFSNELHLRVSYRVDVPGKTRIIVVPSDLWGIIPAAVRRRYDGKTMIEGT